MKANAPEKIYIQPDAHDGWFESNPHSNIFVEYTRTDAFIEKTKEFLWSHIEGSDYHVNYVLNEFEKYIKGENV